jgi:hypothetical protein
MTAVGPLPWATRTFRCLGHGANLGYVATPKKKVPSRRDFKPSTRRSQPRLFGRAHDSLTSEPGIAIPDILGGKSP